VREQVLGRIILFFLFFFFSPSLFPLFSPFFSFPAPSRAARLPQGRFCRSRERESGMEEPAGRPVNEGERADIFRAHLRQHDPTVQSQSSYDFPQNFGLDY